MTHALPRVDEGLYEQIITASLDQALRALDPDGTRVVRADLMDGEAHIAIAQHLHGLLVRALRTLPEEGRVAAQLNLANRVVDLLAGHAPRAGLSEGDRLTPEQLLALVQAGRLEAPRPPERPGVPLSQSELLVNAPHEHRVGVEIARELASSDRVDLLCSFVKWSGFVRIRDALAAHLRDRGRPMRVITTAYMGATERRAIDELVQLGAEVRISYDTRRTRLHAKAWLFYRKTGFTTAYIGSSNLSAAALTDGLEWNVRISSVDNPRVVGKFEGTFEGYWADPEFEPYEPGRDGGRFEEAVREALGERGEADERVTFFDLRPYPFQQEILDRLAAERDGRERHRNLVVAATGTGKTLVAALDYARLGQAPGGAPPTLLFIAHREELLVQSRAVFRQALRDRAFGEMLVGGARPLAGSHVFASIQSLARVDLARLPPDAYDVVIVDEFHHAAAPTYARLLAHLRPKELLGLTATPERADGESVLDWFDGRVAAEVRLWDAIDRGLLCPFQYFGVRDQVDLDLVTWRRGYVPSELEDLYTADDARVMLVLEAVRERVAAPRRMRALGFCVSVRHAEFMASRFTERGVPARAVTGLNTVEQRRAAISALQRKEVNVLFTVDLFNEGVDLPWVDTILALRPTESATIFLQQLGRGLRLHRGKECLTVLDFIGKQHDHFRFDHRFRALTNATRAGLIEQIEQGFPRLPSGCAIHLEPEAMRIVLDNVQRVIRAGSSRLVEELRAVARARGGDVSLAEFLREASIELGVIYRNGRTFTALRRAAGLPTPPEGPGEKEMGKALGRLLHLDDPGRIARIAAVIREGAARPRGEAERREVLMLGAALLGPSGPQVVGGWLRALGEHPALRGEMLDLLDLLAGEVPRLPRPFTDLRGVPLALHCRYLLAEVMAAFGSVSANGQRVIVPQTGVYLDKPTNAELLFVTLQKSARHYSPSTMYEDYAISPTEFHWQSQNHVTTASAAGKRHIDHRSLGVTPLLFVRQTKHDDRGKAAPYVFLGPVEHVSHRGERPISIVWRLPTPMPADLFRDVKLAAG